MPGQVAAIAQPQLLKTLAAIAARRLIPPNALAKEQTLDAVDMERSFVDQYLALATDPATGACFGPVADAPARE